MKQRGYKQASLAVQKENYAVKMYKKAGPCSIARYKPDLRETVKMAVSDINYLRHKDTMHSLIAKDIENVLCLLKDFGK